MLDITLIFSPMGLYPFYGDDVRAYVMDAKYSVNINTSEDWSEAEKAIEKLRNEERKSALA